MSGKPIRKPGGVAIGAPKAVKIGATIAKPVAVASSSALAARSAAPAAQDDDEFDVPMNPSNSMSAAGAGTGDAGESEYLTVGSGNPGRGVSSSSSVRFGGSSSSSAMQQNTYNPGEDEEYQDYDDEFGDGAGVGSSSSGAGAGASSSSSMAIVPAAVGAGAGSAPARPVAITKYGVRQFVETQHGLRLFLQNCVASCDMKCNPDLAHIATHARNAEYNPQRFAAVIMRIREPKCTALIFHSGKVVVTGSKNEDDALLAARKIAQILVKLGFSAVVSGFKIQNMVATGDCAFPIRLEGMADENCESSATSACDAVCDVCIFVLTLLLDLGMLVMHARHQGQA